ncbi:MAG TPA: hypothetical protein VMS43_06920 [Allosphingosinicella sp.]|nr:hypothetical protein [Allosphingosinicella sp.]
MKSLTLTAAVGLALALSGCGDTTPPNAQAPAITIANPGSDRLKTLSPLNQRIGLLHAITQSGKRCGRVLTGVYQQRHENLAMWVAICEGGKAWAVFIAPTEDIQVSDCAEHRQLGLPLCRPVPPLPADPGAPPGTEVNASEIEAANRNLTNGL